VIDSYSRDKTVEVALKSGAQVIQVDRAFSIGGAVEAGILYAYRKNYDLLIRLDGDGQHPPSEVKKIIEPVKSRSLDFVIGSRFLGQSDYQPNFLRSISIGAICFMLKFLHRVKITDCTSGCQIYSKDLIRFFAEDKKFEYSEIRAIWMAHQAGFKIEERFINMAEREFGESTFSLKVAFLYMFKNILDLILSVPVRKAR
jgi:hypothetical protein